MSFSQLKDLLKKPLNKYGLNRTVETSQLCSVFQEIIEEEIPSTKGEIKVVSFKNQTFNIKAPAALAQKIDMQRIQILDKLKEQTGKGINNLRFTAI